MASGIELKGYTETWVSGFKEAYDLAIKAVETGEVYMTGEDYNLYMEGYKAGKKDFEPKQGEWIDHSEDGYVECPFCGHLTNCEDNIDELHYCWNCGAEMKGDKDDSGRDA